jgi:predicted HicB family RNase H-like nuclease
MGGFEKFLPKGKPIARTIKAVMVRPPEDVCAFLVRKAELHAVSVNQVCVAILQAAMEKDKKESP